MNRFILTDPDLGGPVAVAYELMADKGATGLKSLPGIGLIGIMFSLEKEKPQAMICGVLNHSKEVPLYGVKHTLCCQFYPGQFTRIFGIPGKEVADAEAPLDDFIRVGSVLEEISQAAAFPDQIAIVQRFIQDWKKRSLRCSSQDELVRYLMTDALRRHGSIQIGEMEAETGYSARYLQKVMLEHVGLAPKVAFNNIKFQNVMRSLLEDPYRSLAQIAQECGYYDQSYFTKIFREYTGETPAVFVKKIQAMLRHGEKVRK